MAPDEVRRTRLRQDDELTKHVMSWILLIAAGLLEAIWAVGLKFTHGFTKPIPSLIVGSAIVGSMILLALALRDLPVGTAYAVWVSIGILGAAIAQPLIFNEPLRGIQVFFLVLLLIAVVGLKVTAK
jgi:quaternary ammonium compound-resistance protein SugE